MAWTGVLDISVVTESGQMEAQSGVGHWTGVVVSVLPIDAEGDPVEISPSELVERVELIDYVDESELNREGSSGWCYQVTSRPFEVLGEGGPAGPGIKDGSTVQVKFDVSCRTSPAPIRRKSIGIRVRTDEGVKVSSQNGGDGFFNRVVIDVEGTDKPIEVGNWLIRQGKQGSLVMSLGGTSFTFAADGRIESDGNEFIREQDSVHIRHVQRAGSSLSATTRGASGKPDGNIWNAWTYWRELEPDSESEVNFQKRKTT
ncbi:hypothetical protein ABZ990_28520 [Streptomyces sp. NPDC046203]|uniref:hypothetical protein n=1 Tax=Streptomyces sp. NPDC046203 TaxID=3154602 RepID=UPI00340E38F8